jgi:hypothetical protein
MKANQNRIFNDVKFLTELRPFRNYKNLQSLSKCVDYIKNEFKQSDLEVHEQKWHAHENEYTNVIGIFNPGKPKTLVVGAHYDVCGDQPGADDNASAVAGMLEIARLLGEGKPVTDYTIELVGYCLEEPPFFGTESMGSHIHAKSLFLSKREIIGMICFEMIGYFSDKPNSQPFPYPDLASIYPTTANFIMTVGHELFDEFNQKVCRLMGEKCEIGVYNLSMPGSLDVGNISELSDHMNYWEFGYNALMINDTAYIRNPNYHKPSDTIETLDFEKMREVINGAYHAITNLS